MDKLNIFSCVKSMKDRVGSCEKEISLLKSDLMESESNVKSLEEINKFLGDEVKEQKLLTLKLVAGHHFDLNALRLKNQSLQDELDEISRKYTSLKSLFSNTPENK